MVAASRLRSRPCARPATAAPLWCGGSGHCRTPGESYVLHKLPPGRSRTPGRPCRISCAQSCKLACQSCSPRRRRPLASRSFLGRALRAAVPPAPTCAPTLDTGGFPLRPERSGLRQRSCEGPFFEDFQLALGPHIGRLVALAFHRVLGALERKAFLGQDGSQAIVAELDLRRFLQMLGQAI